MDVREELAKLIGLDEIRIKNFLIALTLGIQNTKIVRVKQQA